MVNYERRFRTAKRRSPKRHMRRAHMRNGMKIGSAIVGSGLGFAKGSYAFLKKRRDEAEEKRKENEAKKKHEQYLEAQKQADQRRIDRLEAQRKKEIPKNAESKSNLKNLAQEVQQEQPKKSFNPFKRKEKGEYIEA